MSYINWYIIYKIVEWTVIKCPVDNTIKSTLIPLRYNGTPPVRSVNCRKVYVTNQFVSFLNKKMLLLFSYLAHC